MPNKYAKPLSEEERAKIKKEVSSEMKQYLGELLGHMPPRIAINPNKVGRNETCPCGSGVKYKRCCGKD